MHCTIDIDVHSDNVCRTGRREARRRAKSDPISLVLCSERLHYRPCGSRTTRRRSSPTVPLLLHCGQLLQLGSVDVVGPADLTGS